VNIMATAKVHIKVAQGTFEAEGAEEFVWKIYEDFRDNLQINSAPAEPMNTLTGDAEPGQPAAGAPKRTRSRRPPGNKASKESAPGLSSYRPTIVDDLDTRGIKEFIAPYAMSNHSNNIVAFLKFLETKGRKPASFNDVFTCYRDAGIKVPEAFAQAFIDTRGKKKLIQFTGPNDVELTLRGGNHIDHGGMNKSAKE
jgi:hypothetical protein